MEMEEISKEPEATTAYEEPSAGASKGKSEEEEEAYSKLHNPSEDVYAEAQFPLSKKKAGEALRLRLWKGVSAILGLICLILIFIVVALALRLQNSTSPCPPAPVIDLPYQRSTVAFKPCQVSQCAPGWVQHGESCFFLSTKRNTWDEAKRNCTDMSADLAVIRTANVQKFLSHSEPPLKYWIGLKRERTWVWVNGQSMTDNYFSTNSSSGNCAMLRGGDPSDKNWFRSPCLLSTYFICERRVSSN